MSRATHLPRPTRKPRRRLYRELNEWTTSRVEGLVALDIRGLRAVAPRRGEELHSLVDALNRLGQPVSGGG